MPPLPQTSRSPFWLRSAAALSAVALLAMLGWVIWRDDQANRVQADAVVLQAASAAADQTARSLEEFDHQLLTIIYRHQSQPLRDIDPRARDLVSFEKLRNEPYFAFADVLDTSGRSVAGVPRNDSNWFDSNYFGALEHSRSSDMFLGDPFSRADEKAVGFTVSRRMTDGEDRFAGVVVLGVRLAYFRQLLARFADSGRSVVLLRRDGTVIMRLPFRLNDVGIRLEPQTPLDIALRTGAASAVMWDATDRVERRFAFQPVGTFPLVVGIGTPIASLSANSTLWLLLTAVCGAPLAGAPLVLRRWRGHRTVVPEQ